MKLKTVTVMCYPAGHSMSSGPILEICPTSPLGFGCNLVYEFILEPNGQVQNISSMPTMISKLQASTFTPCRCIEKATESLLGYLNRHVLDYYLLTDNNNSIVYIHLRI